MADWEAEDYEPPEPKPVVPSDKWEGEDESDDVKDNWDDEESEATSEKPAVPSGTAVAVKKKKPLAERIAEKKEQKLKELEQKRLEAEQASKELTAEEEAAERLRVQRLQEESDFMLAKEAFGVSENAASDKSGLEFRNPVSKEDFDKFAADIEHMILKFEKLPQFASFVETLFRGVAAGMNYEDTKRLGTMMSTIANEKAKVEKQTKGKTKKKAGAKLVVQRDNDYGELEAGGGDEFDDFI